MTEHPWSAVETNPQCEDIAERWYVAVVYADYRVRDALAELGVQHWLPECLVRRTARRAIITLKGPLFPGYLFVRGRLTDEFVSLVKGIRDVDRFLGSAAGMFPVPVNDQAMDNLQRLVAECGGRVLIERGDVKRGYRYVEQARFEPGQSVRVIDGPYEGLSALYQAEDGKERIKILLDMLGRSVQVSMPEALVEPA